MGKVGKTFDGDAFKRELGQNERFRLKNGKLIVEQSSTRSIKMNAWQRFWTRGEYSQSAILKEMGKLYKAAKAQQAKDHFNHITESFINNYNTLLDRATAQNAKYKDVSFITRFFKAKREIQFKTNEIVKEYENFRPFLQFETKEIVISENANVDEKTEYNKKITERTIELRKFLSQEEKNPWWANCEEDEYPGSIFDTADGNFIVSPDQFTSVLNINLKEMTTKNALVALLKATGLETVQNHIDKRIFGPKHFNLHLLKNKESIIKELHNLGAIDR